MKNIYLAYIVEEDGKYYSYGDVIKAGENLLNILNSRKNLIVAHICETRKKLDELVTDWNRQYKKNGTYLFGDAPLF